MNERKLYAVLTAVLHERRAEAQGICHSTIETAGEWAWRLFYGKYTGEFHCNGTYLYSYGEDLTTGDSSAKSALKEAFAGVVHDEYDNTIYIYSLD